MSDLLGAVRRQTGAAAAFLAVLCLALAGCARERVVPRKVVLIGIDGADWAVLDRLRAAGRVPALEKLISAGASGPLGTFRPTLSPALWTTVATGVSPPTHGIENFVVYRPQATFVLPPLPPGGLTLELRVEIRPPCTRDLLEVYLNRMRLTGGRWNGTGLDVELPDGMRRQPDVVMLRLPPRCAPSVPPKKGAGTPEPAARPWGTLGAVTVRAPEGEPVVTLGPEQLARDENGIRAGGEGEDGMLLGGLALSQIESGDRRVPALWNIATARDRSVGVVGWWCTWPAERVRGTLVSDVLFFASTRRLLNLERLPEETLEAGAVYPPEARSLLAEALPAEWTLSAEELAEFVPRTSPRFAEHLGVPARVASLRDPPLVILKDTYLLNRPHFAISRRLAASNQPDLLLVYTNLVDAVEHKFWRYYEPERFGGVTPEELEDFGDTIARTYAHVDREVGALVSAVGSDTVVLVVSDHGHHAAPDGGIFSGEHGNAPPGILIAAGPGIRQARNLDGATLYDLAPTVLALLGLPVADDMPGRVLEKLFTRTPSLQHVATYSDLPREPAEAIAAPAVGESVRERLRALGYLE